MSDEKSRALGLCPASQGPNSSGWSQKYGEKHTLHRVTHFPMDIIPPKRIRLYRRVEHFVLQWWDPRAKRNLSDRVDGDLVAALARAREIEERLENFRTAGKGQRRLDHEQIVELFLRHLSQRADAGEIATSSVDRYQTALQHYLAFCKQPEINNGFPIVANINQEFQMALAGFLANRQISSNGHPHTPKRPMKNHTFILDAVRAMLQWAADADRANLLPIGFRNPFLRHTRKRIQPIQDPLAEPDITSEMVIDFVESCDAFQFRLFVPMILFGLRASEPVFLFREFCENQWLRVPCLADLGYVTKGKRDKRFPVIDALQLFWKLLRQGPETGLLYRHRRICDGSRKVPLQNCSLSEMTTEFQNRCNQRKTLSAAAKTRLRNQLWRDAGGLNYDHIHLEFRSLARKLDWPRQASLKDFRHLFCTTLGNSSMPEAYRRYLMGHAPDKSAIMAYTHLNRLPKLFADAIESEWAHLVQIVDQKATKLIASAAGAQKK